MDGFLTVAEAAKVLGVAKRTVGYWVERKQRVGKFATMVDGVYYLPIKKVKRYWELSQEMK